MSLEFSLSGWETRLKHQVNFPRSFIKLVAAEQKLGPALLTQAVHWGQACVRDIVL